jgi:hypothetical protein
MTSRRSTLGAGETSLVKRADASYVDDVRRDGRRVIDMTVPSDHTYRPRVSST